MNTVLQTTASATTYIPVLCNFNVLNNSSLGGSKTKFYIWVASNSDALRQRFVLKGCQPNTGVCNNVNLATVEIPTGNTPTSYVQYEVRVEVFEITYSDTSNVFVSLNGGVVKF